jgi:hypothetical protein
MAKHMKLWVVGGLLLAVGGSVIASNMGFKFVPNLNLANRSFAVALPINNNYTNADSIFADINSSGCGAAKVERINPSTGGSSRTTWVGFGSASDNFSVAKGEGYIVEVSGSCTNWVVVGSHDPVQQYSFALANRSYLVSVPYHTTATVANDLFLSIPQASKVERINPSIGGSSRTTWVGFGAAADNFSVAIGQAYIVEVGTAGQVWTPAHY